MDRDDQFDLAGWVSPPIRIDPTLAAEVISSFGPADRIGGRKIENAWTWNRAVRRLAAHPLVMGAVEELYGRRPFPFQTLNLVRGSEQALHADSVHFDTLPAGGMCGVWVALEAVGPEQGPLAYVPGSHRLAAIREAGRADAGPRFDYAAYERQVARDAEHLPMRVFHAEPGEVLIWHADLLHGGMPVLDPARTRWSQVTHYFFHGDAYITPMRSSMSEGRYRLRDPLIDISTGRRVRPSIDGAPARVVRLAGGLSTLEPRGGPGPSLPVAAGSALRTAREELRHRAALVRARSIRR